MFKNKKFVWFLISGISILLTYCSFWAVYGLKIEIIGAPIAFSILLAEVVAASWAVLISRKYGNKSLFVLASLVLLIVSLINVFQVLAIVKSGILLDKEAFNNLEHIGFMIDDTSLIITSIFLFYAFLVIRSSSKLVSVSFMASATPILTMLLFLIAINNINSFKYIKYSYQSNKRSFTEEFVKIFTKKQMAQKQIFLTETEISRALDFGFAISPNSHFPLQKTDWKLEVLADQPNIIVLFVESLSAEFVGAYGGKYANLTPNIDRFLSHNLKITNYYNHAFPTVTGLKGQLCSTYPAYTHSEWANAISELKQANMRCLPHHLSNAGYETLFLGYSHPGYTFFEEQMKATGFAKTLFWKTLSDSLLDGKAPSLSRHGLGDDQMLMALGNYLETPEKKEPFFVAVSTIGTHPGLDTEPEFYYGDGQNRVLNVLHRFDKFFGDFLDRFESMKFDRKTVLILTADHAHLPSKEFADLARDGFVASRLNEVVFGIKVEGGGNTYEANTTSIDFAPTVLGIAGVKNRQGDHLLGSDLFADGKSKKSIGSYADEILIVDRFDGGVVRSQNLSAEKSVINYIRQLEREDRICCFEEKGSK